MHVCPSCHAPTDTPARVSAAKPLSTGLAKNDEVKAVLRRAVLQVVRREAEEAGEDADKTLRLKEEEMDA
jgi:hypothetical protein